MNKLFTALLISTLLACGSEAPSESEQVSDELLTDVEAVDSQLAAG